MTNETDHQAEAWKYAKEAMTWYGWRSPIGSGLGFSLFILPIGLFILLLHFAGAIR